MSDNKLYWEDFAIGQTFAFGRSRVSREDIIDFAMQYDPQPFHLDETAAKKTLLRGLAASGWHTCAVFMRMVHDEFLVHARYLGSPGLDEIKWLLPVRPGDVLTARGLCLESIPMRSQRSEGLCTFRFEAVNAAGQVVMTWRIHQIFKRRRAGQVVAGKSLLCAAGAFQGWRSAVERNPGDHAIKYFEDIELGDEIALGSYDFTARKIKVFAQSFDPQPMHSSGGLSASGWHVSAAWMQRIVRYYFRQAQKLARSGQPVPQLGPASGIKNLRWHAPVHAGDTVTFSSWAEHKVAFTNNPKWGLFESGCEGVNQHGEPVISFFVQLFIERRGAGGCREIKKRDRPMHEPEQREAIPGRTQP